MEENFLFKRNSRDQQCERAKLRLSYASENHEKEHLSGKGLKEEEIVKYMYNLPAYLERRSDFRENGLNVGVLDWRRLERWHCVQKRTPGRKNITESASLTGRAELYSEIPCPREGILSGKNSIGAPSAEKSVSFSPFSRLSTGLNRKNRGSSSVDDSDIPRRSSATTSVHPKSENAYVSSNDKRRSSPLRRLLDPILKTKAGICNHSIEKIQMSSNVMSESSTKQSTKVRLDMSRCRKVDVNQAVEDKKRGPTRVRALLQAVVKNGLPLLTFAVDNVADVLAATMKSTGSEKEKTRIYTFFTIREVKRKTGSWMNQGGNQRKGRDFISNVVAQMKVSELRFSSSTRREKFSAKEFVLFSVNRRLSEQQNPDFQSDNELAAIVIKTPWPGNASRRRSTGGETIFNTTVILPGGNHSIPNKGGPSSLIERWSSGGACDCGGWDLGCRLRVLASSDRITKKSSSSDQLELSSQEGEVENQAILRMATSKDKVFTIEFGSTLSHIQAFAISIALLDCRNLSEFGLGERSYDEIRAVHRRKPTAIDTID